MTTTKPVKVSNLSGPALDWAVAKCEDVFGEPLNGLFYKDTGYSWIKYSPSSDWSLAGPIIERERISNTCHMEGRWLATMFSPEGQHVAQYGSSPAVSAMRCYVASKLGNTVEIPEELI